MYARLLRFDVGFGHPELAEEIARETEAAMSRHPGYRSMQLLADYLGGRYVLISYWDSDRHLYDFSYSPDAAKTVLARGGTARRTAIEKMLTGLGGRLESFDFAFGSDDFFIVVDLPSNEAAAATAMTVAGPSSSPAQPGTHSP